MKNNVRKLREKKKLTQRRLAELAGTSQQQIQRIESRQMATSMQTAMAISTALDVPLDKVFPGATTAYSKLLARRASTGYVYDEDLNVASSGPGIELDPSRWTLVFRLRGHQEDIKLRIPAAEARRLKRVLRDGLDDPGSSALFLFDAHSQRVALRLSELSYAHFLFDPIFVEEPESEPEDAPSGHAYLVGSPASIGFSVDYEAAASNDDEELDAERGQLAILFDELEAGVFDDTQWVDFEDVDGERLFLRATDIAMLVVETRAFSELEIAEEEAD